jgi:hypothetical protein
MTIYTIDTGSLLVDYTKNFQIIPSSGLDPDAENYITAVDAIYTLSDPEKEAIDTLFKDLKDAGIYSEIQAMYPFLGSSAASQKFNAVNPVDSNAAYRLTFNGSMSFSAISGCTGGGGYADTYMASTVDLLDFDKHFAAYNMIDTNSLGGWDGVWDTGGGGVFGINMGTSNSIGLGLNDGPAGQGGTPANWDGFYVGVVSAGTANNNRLYKDGSQQFLQTYNPSTFSATQNYLLWSLNFSGPGNGHNRNYGFYSIGKALTGAQVSDYNTIITTFLTAIGRI